ncbi:hypothetical protein PG987_008784 [Apiospora arundinis]
MHATRKGKWGEHKSSPINGMVAESGSLIGGEGLPDGWLSLIRRRPAMLAHWNFNWNHWNPPKDGVPLESVSDDWLNWLDRASVVRKTWGVWLVDKGGVPLPPAGAALEPPKIDPGACA